MSLSISKAARFLDNSRRSLALLSLLAAALLFVQSADLTHTHIDDLQAQVDCEICLKFGSDDDAIAVTSGLADSFAPQQFVANPQFNAPILAVLSANPRAPPLA